METGAVRGSGARDRGGHEGRENNNQTINHKKTHTALMNKKDIVAKVIQFIVTVLSAVLTTFGLQGTM